MKLLLVNTCGAEGSLALADTSSAEPIVALTRMPGRTASERLVAALREVMAEAGWKLRDLVAIAVVTGPGSFTGVRVGLSAAKGLSEASGVPLIAISRLALLAAAAGPGGDRVCALLDAGRDEFYYGSSSGEFREALLSKDAAIEAASQADVVVVCEQTVTKALEGIFGFRLMEDPTAADALTLALKRFAEAAFADPMALDANYLRRTDAEIFSPKVAPTKPIAQPTSRRRV